MRIRASVILCILSLTLFSTYAQAASRANTLTFNVLGGYEFFSSQRHIENLGYPLVGIGYNFTDQWGVEALLGWFHTNFNPRSLNERQISGTLFLFDALYRFPSYYCIEPFVEFGLGVTGLTPNRNDGTNEANINAGVGFNWFADQTTAFRVDVRDLYTLVGGKNDALIEAGVTFFLDFC